jgi:hypothetical protein
VQAFPCVQHQWHCQTPRAVHDIGGGAHQALGKSLVPDQGLQKTGGTKTNTNKKACGEEGGLMVWSKHDHKHRKKLKNNADSVHQHSTKSVT